MEEFMVSFVPYVVHALELMGIFVIIVGAVRTFIIYVRSRFDVGDSEYKLYFAQSLAFALEFKLGAEILKTVITKTMSEIYMLGAIIILRAILTVVIHYEIKIEKSEKTEREG